MNLLEASVWLNAAAIALALAIGLTAYIRFRHPLFLLWIGAHVGELGAVLVDLAGQAHGRPPASVLGIIAFILLGIWCHFQLAVTLRERPMPHWTLPLWFALGLGYAGTVVAMGGGLGPAALPFVLIIPYVLAYLGWAFIHHRGSDMATNAIWLGGPLLLRGVHGLAYPVLAGGPHEWLFQVLSALLHLVTGVGIVMFLASDTLRELSARNALLEAQHAELLRLDRLKSNFLATMSHELRTPLTAVKGVSEILAMPDAELAPDERARLLDALAINAQNLERLFQDMLDYAMLESREMAYARAEGDMVRIVRDVAAAFEPVAQAHGLALALEAPETPLWSCVDEGRIGQVLFNLLTNACKFSPTGETIRLRVYEQGGEVCLEVIDRGIGIAEHELMRIFDRFYQVDSSTTRPVGGAGLGLAISRAIVEEGHGGRISVTSRPGEGSTFRVALPLVPFAQPVGP